MKFFLTVAAICLSLPVVPLQAAGMPFRPLPAEAPIPADNPQTEAKIALGKALFFDPALSFSGQLSCNSCHDLGRAGEDGLSFSTGALGQLTERSTPTLWNVAFQTVYFLDGRAKSLEAAIAEHLLAADIMAMPNKATVTGRLLTQLAYRTAFTEVFGRQKILAYEQVAQALASFLRTLTTPDSDFDRYLQGEKGALSPLAQLGFKTFVERGCAACHFWVNMAGPVPGLNFKQGEGFYELFPTLRGTVYEQKYDLLADLGRYRVTGADSDRYMWRVQSLRNIALTAPYFHNGSVADLPAAVRLMSEVQFGIALTSAEVEAIVAFLKTLTGKKPILSGAVIDENSEAMSRELVPSVR